MSSRAGWFREILFNMVEKELRARYKHTIFGFFWLVLNPLLQMVIIGLIFTYFLKEPVANYYPFLFLGLLVWNFFSLSLTKATPSIIFERSLIKKSNFPREIIPLSIILSNFIHFLVALSLFLPITLKLNLFAWAIWWYFPLALILLLLITIGLSLLACAYNVRFRDINFFVQALLIIWFYATPVIYTLEMLPPSIRWLWYFNPMILPLQLLQSNLIGKALPDQTMWVSNLLLIFCVFSVGLLVFRRESKFFDDWI